MNAAAMDRDFDVLHAVCLLRVQSVNKDVGVVPGHQRHQRAVSVRHATEKVLFTISITC